MSKEMKAEVLAKCGELYNEPAEKWDFKSPKINGYDISKPLDALIDVYELENDRGTIMLTVGEHLPETDPVWSLAHAVLFGEKPEERPSEGILWQAWVYSMYNQVIDCGEIEKRRFAKFLETLPTDPLATDRELVWKAWLSGEINLYTKETAEALSRLCGMEGGAISSPI